MIQTDNRVIDSEELLRKIRIKVLNKGLETNQFSVGVSNDRSAILSRIRKDALILDQSWSIHDSEIKAGFIRRSIKRLIRKTVYWLIRPYWDQQITYNAAVTRIIDDMLKLHESMTK